MAEQCSDPFQNLVSYLHSYIIYKAQAQNAVQKGVKLW